MHRFATVAALVMLVAACGALPQPLPQPANPPAVASPAAMTSAASRVEHPDTEVVATGVPIELDGLTGRILFDDFEDVFAMDVDGTNLVTLAGEEGAEFDGAWSPDGQWVAYRDSTRGINEDDEIAVVRADGSDRRILTDDPANDWGPDWSPDGRSIVFNSDRGGSLLRGYLMDPDGTNVRPLGVDAWVEYPSFSPDGRRLAFMGTVGSNYEVFVADVASGAVRQLTDAPGQDGWPAWSPDGTTIAFSSVRDDCAFAPPDAECWRADSGAVHYDTWLVDPDGANLRRATPEYGQFVAWSPDSRHLLVSGYALYVIRPDGTGRLELRADGIERALGGIPDWGP